MNSKMAKFLEFGHKMAKFGITVLYKKRGYLSDNAISLKKKLWIFSLI